MRTKCILFIFTILSSIGFFNPGNIFTPQIVKLMFYVLFIITGCIALKNKYPLKYIHYPKAEYKCLISGMLFSIIMVITFQNQSGITTIIATLPFVLPYLFLIILFKLAIPKDLIIRIIIYLCISGMIIYTINYITFPSAFFNTGRSELDETRGLRIYVPFIELDVLLFFYSINQYLYSKKKSWVLLMILTAIFIIQSVTRQIILVAFVFGILLFLQNISFIKKGLLIILLYIFYIAILPQIPIYQKMVELSETQAENNKYKDDDIRLQAWNFYTKEYQTNILTPIFGNGVPSLGNSKWGNRVEMTTYVTEGGNGCYTVDVGWAGFFWYFGMISTLSLLILLIKALLKYKKENERYQSYWVAFIILTSFTSGPILFQYQILSIVIVLYLIYAPKGEIYKFVKI